MMEKTKIFLSAVMAGIAIAIGGVAFIKVGGIIGSVLFTFGLLTVVHYGLYLFTGKAGFISTKVSQLVLTLIGNIVGCLIVGVLMNLSSIDISEGCIAIVNKRMEMGVWSQALPLSMFCGFIMTTAVEFGRNGKYLPLLFGVPLFILCGFLHSIADAFYIACALVNDISLMTSNLMLYYVVIVFGNYIGCNAYRLFVPKEKELNKALTLRSGEKVILKD